MAERALGLDIGTTAVRVVEVVIDRPGGRGRHPGHAVVSRVGEVPLPPGAVRDGEVADPAVVGAAISELWRQTGLRSRDVRVGLTGSRVVVRVVDMPAMPDDELEGAVRFSAADHIPIPLEEAVLDHAVLEPAPPGEPGAPEMVRVLVAAAHRSALDGLLAAVAAGGLRAVAVDLVPFALVRGLTERAAEPFPIPSEDSPELSPELRPAAPALAEAVVSVGAALTTVVVHEGGRPRFVRTVQAGGDMLTAAVADELGIDLEAAEAAKRDANSAADPGANGLGADGSDNDLARRAARVVELRLAGILGEIQSSLAYWMAQSDRPLRRIVLTGGGARAGDIAGRLALLVGAPVELGAVQGLEAPEPAAGAGEWPDLTVAAGLALGGTAPGWQIDFCPPVKRSFRFSGEMGRRMAVAAVIVVVALSGLSVRSVMAVSGERSRLAAQKKANAKVESEIAHLDSLRRLSTDLEAGRRRVQSALAGDVSWTRFLGDLVRSMPSGVWLQSVIAQTTPAGKVAAAPPAGTGAAPAGAATTGIGSLQVTAIGLDYPAVADWLRMVGTDPSLSGLAVGTLTSTPMGARTVVNFGSTATITPTARSDRPAQLAKAGL
jgi:type IV pilus assembly protein PilM